MTAMVALGAAVFGAMIGSFLNVVVYRLPLGRSLVFPPSACTHCGRRLIARDNIPVVSWLLLRGRCRQCESPISTRYILVEVGTAAFFAVVIWQVLVSGRGLLPAHEASSSTAAGYASALMTAALLYLAAVSVALALIDLDTHRLPDVIVLPSYLVAGVLLAAASVLGDDLDALIRAGIGLAALGGAYFIMAWAHPGGMGFGDVKLAGVLGLYLGWLGWEQLAVGAFAAFLLGGLYAVILLAARRVRRGGGIPFGPWMLAGAWAGIFFGQPIADGYLGLFGLA